MRLIPFMVFLLVLLTGCAAFAPDMTKVSEPRTVLVTWERVQPTECGAPGRYLGCATRTPGYTACLIQMPEDAPDWVVAEEFRHCFAFEHSREKVIYGIK